MPRTLEQTLPWLAIAIALALAVVYFAFRPKDTPETFEGCMTRLTTPGDTEATGALNRAVCAGHGQMPQGQERLSPDPAQNAGP